MSSTIIDKVLKMLALAEGNKNPHEAAVATAKAQAFMMQHNIEAQEIAEAQGKKAPSPVGVERFRYSSQKSYCTWQAALLNTVTKMYFCSAIGHPKTGDASLIGEPENREVAKQVFFYLRDEVLRLESIAWGNGAGNGHHRGFWNQFCMGATSTITSRLNRERSDEAAKNNKVNALVITKDRLVTEETARLFPNITQRKSTTQASDAYYKGIVAGRGVPLKPGSRQIAA